MALAAAGGAPGSTGLLSPGSTGLLMGSTVGGADGLTSAMGLPESSLVQVRRVNRTAFLQCNPQCLPRAGLWIHHYLCVIP